MTEKREPLTYPDTMFLRAALHTEGVLSGDYAAAVRIRVKLGLARLAGE
jgi:hypothetical protein